MYDENDKNINPFHSLEGVLAQSVRDWTENKYDMWIYGIIFGYDEESIRELQFKYHWFTDAEVVRLNKLHENYELTAKIFEKGKYKWKKK